MTVRFLLAAVLITMCAWSQPRKITLDEAVATAIRNNPRIALDRLNGLIAGEQVTEVRAGLFPQIFANTTAAGATADSRLAAGTLNNPIIYNRYAAGTSMSQLITDFGRTQDLVESSRLRARSAQQNGLASRAQITLDVHRAYYSALRAANVLTVTAQTIKERELVLDQVSALAKSNLRSTLDVSFADVNTSEARLAHLSAKNERLVALADLSATLGYPRPQDLEPQDVPANTEAPPTAEALISEALQNRPEIAALRLERESAVRVAAAEKKLALPTVSALANMGVAPVHDDRLRNRYAAAGINLSLPLFNGFQFNARRREAELRVEAVDQRLRDLENQIAREVTTAALNAETAFERVALTAQLLKQATLSGELAQERYNLGLGSIVELSQAQLNQTAAEIRNTAAKYDYLLLRSVIDYQMGRLR